MYIIDRSVRFARGALLSFGPEFLKKRVWDKEYRNNKWHFADNTVGDCVYAHLERFARGGAILDLGCGSGNTATELAEGCYKTYTGVDISEEALAMAKRRSIDCGRGQKNSFVRSDFLKFSPTEQYDVILFRESMYHIPINTIPVILDKFARHLKADGVFIVRLFAGSRDNKEIKPRPKAMLDFVSNNYDVIEHKQYDENGVPTVIVFRGR